MTSSEPPRSVRPSLAPPAPSERAPGIEQVMWHRCLYFGCALGLASVLVHLLFHPRAGTWQAAALSAIFASALVGLAVAALALGIAALTVFLGRRACPARACAAGGALGVGTYIVVRSGVISAEPDAWLLAAVGALAGGVALLFFLTVTWRLPSGSLTRFPTAGAFVRRASLGAIVLIALAVILATPGMVEGAGLVRTPEFEWLTSPPGGPAATALNR